MADKNVTIGINVDVKGENEVKGLNRELTATARAGDTGAKGLETAAKGGSSLNSSIKGLVAGGLLAAVGAGLVKFGSDALTAASDVQEMQSKFNTVFKDLGGSVTAELQNFADTANRSIYDLQGFAATLQDTFVPLGFARESAADMSVQLVKLAEDLASFNNLDSAMVVEDLQSALVGNTETLRKYGVVATQAAIDQEALNLGLEFTKGQMDAQTKAAAILSITMKSTSDAQGDAIRTADSYANQLKGLQAAQQELNVELGQVFLPIAGEVVSALTDFAKGGAEGMRAITTMTAAAKQLGEEQRGAAEESRNWNDYGRQLTKTLEENNDVAFKLFGGFKFVRGEIEKTAAASGDFSGTNDELAKSLSDVFGGTVTIEGGLVSLNGQIISEVAILQQLNKEYRNSQALLAGQSAETAIYDAKLIGLNNSLESTTEATKNLIQADEDGLNAAQLYGQANATTAAQIREAEMAETRRALATEASIAANERLVGAFRAVGPPINELLTAQQDLANATGEWSQISISNASEVASVNEQLAKDLTEEQAAAMKETLNTVGEGTAEWYAAYSALQEDLTAKQRQELVAQRTELEAQSDVIASVYSGDVAAAQDAQARIDEANQALIESYKNLALEGSLALAELSPDPAALQRALDYAVGIGAMTEEAANLRLQAANTQLAIEDLNQRVIDGSITSETAAAAFELITSGQARTAEQAIITAENVRSLHGELDGIAGTYDAVINADTSAAEAALARLREQIAGITSGSVDVNSAVGSQLAANAAAASAASRPGFASGVTDFVVPPGYPNDSYMVGLTSGETVNVAPAGQSTTNNMGGITVNVYGGGDNVRKDVQSGIGDAMRQLGIKGF